MECKHCGLLMFYFEPWNVWLCSSWLEMEGGCVWWEEDK